MVRVWSVVVTIVLYAIGFAEGGNPLDTKDQHYLDTRAMSLHLQSPYEDIKQEAREQLLSTAQRHGYSVDSRHLRHRLDVAVDELAFGSMQNAVNNDPRRPKVYWTMAPPRNRGWMELPVPGGRYGFDNPDCIYRTIPMSDAHDYVIHGTRNGVPASDITFSLQNGVTGNTIAVVTGKDLVVRPDGSFTVTVNSSHSTSPNHMRSTPAAKLLLIRYNIGDWLLESPDSLEVELIGGASAGDQANELIITQAREWLRQTISPLIFVLGNLTLSNPVNSMASPSQTSGMGLATQALVMSHYNLSNNAALIVTIEAGPSTYWTLTAYDLWMATDDPRNRLISLNNKQAAANSNGSYTFVLSDTDPRVFNWLNASEDGVGTIVARFQGFPTGGDAVSRIRVWAQLCDGDDLPSVLPHDTAYVTPQQRESQMLIRADEYDRIHAFYPLSSPNPSQWLHKDLLTMEWLGLNSS